MSEMLIGLILIGMHYLIYKITNKLDNKIYVGKHKTDDKNDDYFGSGLLLGRAVEKHGKEHFLKELLFECKTEEEMNQKETDIVDENFIARPDTYNIKLGGSGGFDHINKNKLQNTEKAKLARRKRAEEMRKKFVSLIDDEDFRQEWIQKVKNGTRLHQSLFGNNTFGGKTHSDETKKKMSESKKGKGTGKKNPAFGKHWITNGLISKLVPKTDTLPSGFEKGRV